MPTREQFLLDASKAGVPVDKFPDLLKERRATIGAFDDDIETIKPIDTKDPDQSFLFDVLDFVNRPQYAIAGAINAVVDDNENTKPFEALVAGLSGEEKITTRDAMVSAGWKPTTTSGKIMQGILGFAGDVLTDPLTYTGVGLVSKIGKGEKLVGQGAKLAKAGRVVGKEAAEKAGVDIGEAAITFAGKRIPGTEAIAEPLVTGIQKLGFNIRESKYVGDALNKLTKVSTKLRPKGVDPIEWQKFLKVREKALNLKQAMTQQSLEEAKELAQDIKKADLSTEQIDKIVNQIETKSPITEPVGKKAADINTRLSDTYASIETKSIIGGDDFEHLTRILETKPEVAKRLGFDKRTWSTKTASDKMRKWNKFVDNEGEEFIINRDNGALFKNGEHVSDIDLEELANLGRIENATIKEINDQLGGKLFSTNVVNILATKGQRVAKAKSADNFFKEARDVIGEKLPKGELAPAGKRTTTVPELKDYAFSNDIAAHLDETYKVLTEPDEISKIIKAYNTVQNKWKETATFWNPAFHGRNAVSNVFQNTLAGVRNPKDYTDALKIQTMYKFNRKGLSEAERKIFQEYKDQGLYSVGQMSGDIDRSLQQQLMGYWDSVKAVGKKGTRGRLDIPASKFGSGAGKLIEGNAKLAHFIAKRKAGMSPFDAGQSVKKYLFDYDDLTSLEKNKLKKIIPFYTWTRKNVPLQLEALIKNPSAQTKIVKLKNNIEVMEGDDKLQEILPEWLKNAAPVHIGDNKYIKMEGFIPIGDLSRLTAPLGKIVEGKPGEAAGAPVSDLIEMMSPVLKAPIEQAFNQNFFFGSPLTKQKGAAGFVGKGEKKYFNARIPGRLEHLARLFRPLSEAEKVFGNKYSGFSGTEKFFNYILGAKVYEFEEKDLLRRFDRLSDEEAKFIQGQIRSLKYELKKAPERREEILDDIKLLTEGMRKAKRKSRIKKSEIRRRIR